MDTGFSENVPQNKAVLYGTVNQTLTFTAEYGTAHAYSNILLYFDGRYNSSLTNYGKPFYGTNSSNVELNITQYSESWSGDYTIVSYIFCSRFYRLSQGCRYQYIYEDLVCDVTSHFVILLSLLELSVSTLGENIIFHIIH